jgi:hypothetical protein
MPMRFRWRAVLSCPRYPVRTSTGLPAVCEGTSLPVSSGDNPRLCSQVRSGRCQQGSRIVLTASSRLRVRLAFISRRASIPLRPWSRHPQPCGLDLSASMFAPCLLGCHGTARQYPVLGDTGSRGAAHIPARHGMSRHQPTPVSGQSSRLLICGFGVRVPGGAPKMTWGFSASGHFCVSGLSSWPAAHR